jgi:biopolymer transport protein TolR
MTISAPKKKRGGAINDINVTPLVDILLVLLIIFMVAAPAIHHGARLATPDVQPATDPAQPSQDEEKDTLTLDAQGQIRFRGQNFTDTQLYQFVKDDPHLQKTQELYMRADLNLPYGRVMEVIGTIRRAGIRKLGAVVEADELYQTAPPTPSPDNQK